jgi:hypothetical protein
MGAVGLEAFTIDFSYALFVCLRLFFAVNTVYAAKPNFEVTPTHPKCGDDGGTGQRPLLSRKRTLISAVFRASERPLWRKADIPEYPQDFHNIDQLGTSAFNAKAAIRLESAKRAANDPKRT